MEQPTFSEHQNMSQRKKDTLKSRKSRPINVYGAWWSPPTSEGTAAPTQTLTNTNDKNGASIQNGCRSTSQTLAYVSVSSEVSYWTDESKSTDSFVPAKAEFVSFASLPVELNDDANARRSKQETRWQVVVHFVRHGDSAHNALAREVGGRHAYLDPKVFDPPLTELGIDQAKMLRHRFGISTTVTGTASEGQVQQQQQQQQQQHKDSDALAQELATTHIDHNNNEHKLKHNHKQKHRNNSVPIPKLDAVYVSPLRRTLMTAHYALHDLFTDDHANGHFQSQSQSHNIATSTKSPPIIAVELLRERYGVNICDKRRPTIQAHQEFPLVDFSHAFEKPTVDQDMANITRNSTRTDNKHPYKDPTTTFSWWQNDFELLSTSELRQFELSEDPDPWHSDTHRETLEEMNERAYRFLIWLASQCHRNENHGPTTVRYTLNPIQHRASSATTRNHIPHVAVFTHSSFLFTLFNGVLLCQDSSLREWFETGELRSVLLDFVPNL